MTEVWRDLDNRLLIASLASFEVVRLNAGESELLCLSRPDKSLLRLRSRAGDSELDCLLSAGEAADGYALFEGDHNS